uniref:Uncharacterized protein n=1 Tax=Tanacetum cinerariifolium TaxID=118510 RepID=A0A699J9R0_TANCI|nr:hypothetical protein [Tanacetum cinerariifolium]
MSEDYRLTSEINRVAGKVNNVVVEKDQFLDELDSLGVRYVPAKMAEFLKDIQIIAHDSSKLEVLEAGTHVGIRLKYGYVADMEEKE